MNTIYFMVSVSGDLNKGTFRHVLEAKRGHAASLLHHSRLLDARASQQGIGFSKLSTGVTSCWS